MKKKKISITVGIPVYNEENTIVNLLRTVLAQKNDNYILEEILLNVDGSTDATVTNAKSVKNKKIIILDNKKRLGKPQRLNEIFKKAKGEIIVLLDADVVINSNYSLFYLVQPFLENKKLALVGGNPKFVKPQTFIEEAIAVTYRVYHPFRQFLRGGKNPFACDGHLLALSKSFARVVTIPENLIGTDSYLYFSCLQKGYDFHFASQATVQYKLPNTIQEHVKQNIRFIAAEYLHTDIFGDIIKYEYTIPKKMFIINGLKEFIKKPVHTIFISLLNRYCTFMAKKTYKKQTSLWNIALSTKNNF